MTDRDKLIEEALRDPYSIGGRGSNLEHKLARALQDCEKERSDYKHAAGAEAQLADLNMERAKEAEQRVKELESAMGMIAGGEYNDTAEDLAAKTLLSERLRRGVCPVCSGVGVVDGFWLGTMKKCPACDGRGKRSLGR